MASKKINTEQLARKVRAKCNKLSSEERKEYFNAGMVVIHGGIPKTKLRRDIKRLVKANTKELSKHLCGGLASQSCPKCEYYLGVEEGLKMVLNLID